LNTITWSVHSCRAEPIKRSTRPFCQGERKDVGRSLIPIARTRALNTAPQARSLSQMRYFGAVSQGNASVIWRAFVQQEIPASTHQWLARLAALVESDGKYDDKNEINQAIVDMRSYTLRRGTAHRISEVVLSENHIRT
jgi:hypothetical protein